WLVGLGVTSFTLIPILIIFVFGIPTTRRLEHMKLLKENNGIIKGYLITISLLSSVFFVASLVTFMLFQRGVVGFLIGIGMTFLFGLGQIGKNQNNVRDYVEVNKRHFKTSVESVVNAIMQP